MHTDNTHLQTIQINVYTILSYGACSFLKVYVRKPLLLIIMGVKGLIMQSETVELLIDSSLEW